MRRHRSRYEEEQRGRLGAREQADLPERVADGFDSAPSLPSLRYSAYRRAEGRNPTGYEIVEALLKDAEPAVAAFAGTEKQAATMKWFRLDRDLLEFFPVHGRNMTAYKAAKHRLSPRDPGIGHSYYLIGTVHLLQSNLDEAIVWF